MIQIEGLVKRYNGAAAVDGLDLQIHPQELLVLLGESGCGKTTTLKMINRLIEPDAGTVRLDGVDAATINPVQLRRGIGYVFQGVGLFPHWTVAQNIAATPRLMKWEKPETAARVEELLELMRLPRAMQDRLPNELSGGQRQRVGVARALAARPKVMLMDEPFGALDPITRDELQQEYADLHVRLGLTSVLVTHDMTEALLMADRVAVMQRGRIIRIGTPRELVNDPREAYVAHLIETPRRQTIRVEALMRADG